MSVISNDKHNGVIETSQLVSQQTAVNFFFLRSCIYYVIMHIDTVCTYVLYVSLTYV